MAMQTRIKQRFDYLSNWIQNDIVLLQGELAVVDCESQIRFKIGDGVKSFTQLSFVDQNQLCTNWLVANAISQGLHAASVPYGFAAGAYLCSNANFSQALGFDAQTISSDTYSFVWNGDDTRAIGSYYTSHGKGTFSINALSGLSGIFIGEQSLAELLDSKSGNKIFIDDKISSTSGYSDLSVVKLNANEYATLLTSGQLLSNSLYIVDDAHIDAYGQQIKNIAYPTDLSDAATKGYVDDAISNSLGDYYLKSETSSAIEISNALSVKADLSSIENVVQYEQDYNGNYTAVTIGSRRSSLSTDIGPNSFVNGYNCQAVSDNSHAEGNETYAGNFDAHAEGSYTSAFGDTSHAEGYGTVTNSEGAHAEGGYTSAFGYYSHTEGGWTSTGANAIGAHAEGGFTRADGPISHVEGVKATAELSDYQSFVWQGTDVMPNELTDITPSTWDEYKAHGPGTFNVNPAKGLNGVYISETSLYDLVVDDHMTIIEFDNGEARAFDWSGDVSRTTMIDAGLYDADEDSWTLNPVHVRIGNSVYRIGDNAFSYCSGLTYVTIPDSVTSIGVEAFYNCTNLMSVTIPDSVTSIGSSAFYNCSGLKSVTIPDSVTSIGENAFYCCMGITSVTIPNSVINIGEGAFQHCSELANVIIGKNVKNISYNVFYECDSLINDSNLSSIMIDKGNWEKLFNDVDFEYYRSNQISDGESTSMSASIEASESFPVTIKLKTSSEEGCDILTLTFDGQELTSMSGETGWQYMPVTIPSGSHTVVLTYGKDGSTSRGNDHAYFAIVQGCIAVKGKTQEEAEQLLANANVPETCRIITIDDSSASGENQVDVTYAELVQMRGNGNLAPGMKYRITDYVTAVDQEDCRSAGHQFDIIVAAVDRHTLDENARATIHEGDEYFAARPFHVPDYQQYLEYARVPLESWDIKYCLDNDKTRFKFSDTENGKGVIYWMKDEFGNEAPYDFKNVQFRRYKITSSHGETDLEGMYGLALGGIEVDTSDEMWCYTFNGADYADFGFSEPYDFSSWHIRPTQTVLQQFGGPSVERLQECTGNVIQAKQDDSADFSLMSFKLPNNVFHCALNNEPVSELPFIKVGLCTANKLGYNCTGNTFGHDCDDNTFGNYCNRNTFGNYCDDNTFGNYCDDNTFGNYCQSNTFGNYCDNNTFGHDCDDNTFGHDCDDNTFSYSCYQNIFRNVCYANNFGCCCDSNTFNCYCYSNTFGERCQSNTFGNYCDGNTFGNYCYGNTFGDSCIQIKFASVNTIDPNQAKSYYRYITVDSGNQYIILNCTQSTYSGNEYKNIRILPGVNSMSSFKTITDSNVNQSFCTTYQPANSQVIAV